MLELLMNPWVVSLLIVTILLATYNIYNLVSTYQRAKDAKKNMQTVQQKIDELQTMLGRSKEELKSYLEKSYEQIKNVKKG